MIIAAFYGCSGSHQLTQLEDMQHWSPNGPSRTNGQNTVLTMKNNQTIWKDCQRHNRKTKTNQEERKTCLTFAFCVSGRNVGSHRTNASFNFGLTQQHLQILCYCDCEDVTKWTHKKMHKINDNKILGSMNALMSFNILSVAILAESAKYPTTQPSSRDNAIWDALPQTLLPLANFWWRPIYLNKIFCFAILKSVIFIQWIFLVSIW